MEHPFDNTEVLGSIWVWRCIPRTCGLWSTWLTFSFIQAVLFATIAPKYIAITCYHPEVDGQTSWTIWKMKPDGTYWSIVFHLIPTWSGSETGMVALTTAKYMSQFRHEIDGSMEIRRKHEATCQVWFRTVRWADRNLHQKSTEHHESSRLWPIWDWCEQTWQIARRNQPTGLCVSFMFESLGLGLVVQEISRESLCSELGISSSTPAAEALGVMLTLTSQERLHVHSLDCSAFMH